MQVANAVMLGFGEDEADVVAGAVVPRLAMPSAFPPPPQPAASSGTAAASATRPGTLLR
jgi:hypothetical protein